ncbi:MAG: hypothetical protein AB2401_10885 [Bacillus sp. (in: firmicutes)]|uniref:hypothetical protein n=1 Tax=Bacillus marasmi TaxID=1926279 RepID=UPI0011CAE4B4|nr:hypothetical protein [Bacillus marasmi]
MLDYLLDFTNTYALYSLYVGLALGLLLRLFITWSLNETKLEILSNKINFKTTTYDIKIQSKSRVLPNHILLWIIKYIRNKTGTGDESEPTMISFPT